MTRADRRPGEPAARPRPAGVRALALAATLTLALAGCSAAEETTGPVGLQAPEEPIGWYAAMEPGDVFTDGMQQMFPLGDEPVEILEVTTSGTGDLRLLGAKVAGPDRTENIQAVPGFPPQTDTLGQLQDAEGAVLKPLPPDKAGAGYALLLGYEVGQDDRSLREDVTVRYSVAGQERTVTYKYLLSLCATGTTEECQPPLG